MTLGEGPHRGFAFQLGCVPSTLTCPASCFLSRDAAVIPPQLLLTFTNVNWSAWTERLLSLTDCRQRFRLFWPYFHQVTPPGYSKVKLDSSKVV